MELIIYPYKITQRTEYSKLFLYSLLENKDITKKNEKLLNDIMCDYDKQISNFSNYFEVYNNTVTKTKSNLMKDKIKYIFIPEGITSIGEEAFKKQNFEYISLPSTLTRIGRHSFLGCNNLKYIDIPKSVNKIDAGAFAECSSLKKINLPNLEVLEEWTLNSCDGLEEIVLPATIKSIGFGCFNWCISLKNIIIPESVTEINEYAFCHCINLESVNLPNNLKEIRGETFGDCYKLKNINIPDSVSLFGSGAFEKTQSLEYLTIPKMLSYIGWKTFSESNIKTLIFNHDLNDITGLNNEAYEALENSNVHKLIINNTVKIITPKIMSDYGIQITSIDYLGSKEQFEEFKANNKEFFLRLPNLKEVNYVEKTTEINIENIDR